jgi:hypothetical protein
MLFHTSYRYLLPGAHTLLDLLLAVLWMYHSTQPEGHATRLLLPQTTSNIAYPQENGVTWDPKPYAPAPEFALLLSGTLPAGIIATILRPETGPIADLGWLAIYETIAIPTWLVIGALVDAGRPHLAKWMRIYLFARFLFAATGVALRADGPVWFLLSSLFWLILCCYGFVYAFGWIRLRLSVTSRPAS